jgi:MFS family permease
MTGHIGEYLVIFIVLLAGGCATTAAVYGRIIMERYSRARGLALAIVMSAAPLLGAIGAPMINGIVEDFGWRTAYRVVALVLGGLGLLGVALIPRDGETLKGMQKQGANLRDYPLFLRTSAFLIIFFAMTLNYMSQILNSSQLGLILSDNGASATTAARILSVYAIGVVVGRVFCGLALDRFRPHVVAAIIMAMPGIGQLLLASPFNSTAVLLISLLLMGLTTGAEGDISAFLVMKYFPEKIFGSVNSIVSAGAGAASGIGGIVLGLTFLVNPGFTLFLIIGATAVFAGSVLFLFLGRCRPLAAETVEAAMRQRDDIAAGRPQALT